ncbi:unnamed protein product [Parnassius apollo]|uniref:(apollo) hypothetical protein n=1 Tax=Parnassius apollo TaxID=110799 RepID=A0A8S3XEJ5_PARAO|nr:unnamed protein product [Parnassius apollo]
MSQIVTRQGPVGEDKDKRQTDSPVKEMKKKIAANAEKEKQAAEKNAADKQAEKVAEKNADKKEKNAEKHIEKSADKKEKAAEKNSEKASDKKEKATEKNTEKPAEKKDKSREKSIENTPGKKDKLAESSDKKDEKEAAPKSKDDSSSAEKNGKADKDDEKTRKPDTAKLNGDASQQQNGMEEVTNGTVSESDEDELIIVEQENDEIFPELTYDDNSDVDGFEHEAPSRSFTRRSQVKVTRTPETPRPASDKQADKQADKETDDSKEPKLLKLKEDLQVTDRKLRSSDSPKPSDKKPQEKESPKKQQDSQKKSDTVHESPKKKVDEEKKDKEDDKQEKVIVEKSERVEIEVTVEGDNSEERVRRRDTKYSRSRVRVSPYRRVRRADASPDAAEAADTTASSLLANYTGNNTTMEMDITECSVGGEEAGSLEDSYLSGLRSIRARRSYKPLPSVSLRSFHAAPASQVQRSAGSESMPSRPTGTVVGRKRRPDGAESAGAADAGGEEPEAPKRARLLQRLAHPFRTHAHSTPRRAAEIVGINSDLPLTVPVVAAEPFDPETIKSTPAPTLVSTPTPTPTLVPERDNKRCVVIVAMTKMRRSTVCLFLALQLVHAEYLLPGDIVPRHYDLRFAFDVDPKTNYSFFGVADILFNIKKTTSKIVLHAQDFTVAEDTVTFLGQNDLPEIVGVKMNDTYNFLTITLDKELVENENYMLRIPFFGNLKTGLDGVYISTYVNKNSKAKEYLIATQFEATSARKGFPCFDEPIYKATFRLNIGHHKDYTAVSNMPLYNSSNNNVLENVWPWDLIGKKFKNDQSQFVWDQFESSVPMSTYLVAFVVSKFSYVESPPELSHTKFRIWARSDAINQTSYAAIIGPKVLSHFEQWFNVSFPLPKQDMIAIPDFSAGAMENWGLITYRETALLYDKEQSSFLNKERVAEVIAHELAHQWFGNLVTMKWWSDLWLNEGFATFAASVGVAAAEPTWRADRSYAVDSILSVLSLDALESSHPVSVPIDDPKRISEIFDEISYRKGSTIIRMMTMFLGEDVFRKAINNYLVKYSYSNAEQDDLWAELTAVSQKYGVLTRNVTVKEIMDTWTKQTGYPLLTVTREYGDTSLTISQNRYLALGARSSDSASWWVPLSVVCEGEAAGQHAPQWLAAGEGVRALHRYEHAAGPHQWVLFNADMIAPYRVNYDERNWELLVNSLVEGKGAGEGEGQVPVLGRVQLLTDAFELAWSGLLDYTTALRLASYLQHETDYLPLSTGLRALSKIENVLIRSPDYGAFQKFVRKLIGGTYTRVGGLATGKIIYGDDLDSVKMQATTSSWACRMKVPGCEEKAIELFDNWMNTPNPDENNPIPLDLRRTVYCVALSRGSVRHWRFALERRRNANVAAARDQLLYALSCTRDLWLLAQYLEWAITDGSEVRRQDAAAVITSVTRSTVGYYVARDFIYDRIADIHKAFNHGRRVGYIIKTLLDQFTTQKELNEFLSWRETNAKYLEEAHLAVDQAIERARVNIDWLTRNRRHVVDRLREFSSYRHAAVMDSWEGQTFFMQSILAIHNISSNKLQPYKYEIGER